MTVGIAVLCEKAKSAVVIADRLVSTGVPGTTANLGIDTDCMKLSELAPGVLAVFSGDIHDGDAALSRLGDPSRMDLPRIASRLRSACAKVVEIEADAKLRAYGLRLNAISSPNLATPASNIIINTVESTRMKAGFLVAAIHASKARIYVINDQHAHCQDDPGFAAIGSGSTFCLPILAARRIHKGVGIEEAVFAAYEAKRVAEEVGSVGKQTDMAIISVGKTAKFFSPSLMNVLGEVYDRRLALRKSDKDEIGKLIET